MSHALSFTGSTIEARWDAANEWMDAATLEDSTFRMCSYAPIPASDDHEASLNLEFDADFVEGEHFLL